MKMTKTKPEKEQILEDIDTAIYEVPEPLKIEIGDTLVELSIYRRWGYFSGWLCRTVKQIKEEYKFDEIKDAFDEEKIPSQLEFFFGSDNDNFLLTCNLLSLNEDISESFLCSDMGQNILTNNSLSIHIETGDIFCNDFSTKKNSITFYWLNKMN